MQDAIAGTEQPTILDVGPGHGKYGVLMKEYLTPTPTVDAIEAWAPYITDHNLHGIYRNVTHADILDTPTDWLTPYTCLFLGDIIEHLDKEPGLNFITTCPTELVIVTPATFFHNGDNLPPTETHRSHWTLNDFHATGRVQRSEEHLGGILAHLK